MWRGRRKQDCSRVPAGVPRGAPPPRWSAALQYDSEDWAQATPTNRDYSPSRPCFHALPKLVQEDDNRRAKQGPIAHDASDGDDNGSCGGHGGFLAGDLQGSQRDRRGFSRVGGKMWKDRGAQFGTKLILGCAYNSLTTTFCCVT